MQITEEEEKDKERRLTAEAFYDCIVFRKFISLTLR